MDNKLLTIKEVTAILRVHRWTLRQWHKEGKLVPEFYISRFPRYSLAQLSNFIKPAQPQDRPAGEGLTVDETCKVLGISRTALHHWRYKGKLKPAFYEGNSPRFTMEQLKEFIPQPKHHKEKLNEKGSENTD